MHALNFQIPRKFNLTKAMVLRERLQMHQVRNYKRIESPTRYICDVPLLIFAFGNKVPVLEPFNLNPFCVITSTGLF